MSGMYAKEVHQRLIAQFGEDKSKQYKWLFKHTGKNHVSELECWEFKKVLKYLRKCKVAPEYIWQQLREG